MHKSFGSRESIVFVCESVYVWYEMNYESLICCSLVEIEIQFMKIYFLKLSSLPLFFCGVCFVLKFEMIVYYTWVKDLTGDVTLQWVDGEF